MRGLGEGTFKYPGILNSEWNSLSVKNKQCKTRRIKPVLFKGKKQGGGNMVFPYIFVTKNQNAMTKNDA